MGGLGLGLPSGDSFSRGRGCGSCGKRGRWAGGVFQGLWEGAPVLGAAFHSPSDSIARCSGGRNGDQAEKGVEKTEPRGLLFGLFVRGLCGSGAIQVETVLTVRVVTEFHRAEANDRATIVDGFEGDDLAYE